MVQSRIEMLINKVIVKINFTDSLTMEKIHVLKFKRNLNSNEGIIHYLDSNNKEQTLSLSENFIFGSEKSALNCFKLLKRFKASGDNTEKERLFAEAVEVESDLKFIQINVKHKPLMSTVELNKKLVDSDPTKRSQWIVWLGTEAVFDFSNELLYVEYDLLNPINRQKHLNVFSEDIM